MSGSLYTSVAVTDAVLLQGGGDASDAGGARCALRPHSRLICRRSLICSRLSLLHGYHNIGEADEFHFLSVEKETDAPLSTDRSNSALPWSSHPYTLRRFGGFSRPSPPLSPPSGDGCIRGRSASTVPQWWDQAGCRRRLKYLPLIFSLHSFVHPLSLWIVMNWSNKILFLIWLLWQFFPTSLLVLLREDFHHLGVVVL